MDYLKEFNSKMLNLDRSKSTATIFSDFLTLSAYSIAQPFYRSEAIEQKYLDVAKQYSKEQIEVFGQMLALVVSALEEKFQDFLGQVFSTNDMGASHKGQFFTPYHVSKLMSELTGYNVRIDMENKDILTLSEPCCGSGGMVIAFADSMKESGYNYQKQLFVEAIDIDNLCFKMTYIQLSLLGVPARVMRGDTIAYKFHEALYTPLYFINNIQAKLAERENQQKSSPPAEPIKIELGQLKLF
jgi:hypothetical protein